MPTLYDMKYGGYGYTMNFRKPSDEAKELEEFKRAWTDKMQVPFDYEKLNKS